MANPTADLSSILQLLQDSQRPANATPPVAQPGQPGPPPSLPQAPYGAPPAHNPYPPQVAPPAYQPPPPAAYSYPQPTSSGNIDLSSIRPDSTGALSFQEAIERAKASATQAGLTPYDRHNAGYPGDRGSDSRGYQQRSRSRSPRGREGFRDSNPYRDERRDYGAPSRDYGRDRSFSPRRQGFSPRGHHGGGGRDRDRSPLRGSGDNAETMQVEKSLVGLIIGRQGENLRRVESESRCRVQFINAENEAEPYRVCRITGARAQREEAKAMINRIIADSGMRSGPPGGGGGGHLGGDRGGRDAPRPDRNAPPIPKEGEDTLVIMVPDRTVGLIIGRGGETIRDLQERSGCHINIVSENKSVNGLRPVNLIGTPAATKSAKELILEIVDSDSRNTATGGNARAPRNDGGYGGGGQDKINDSIYVPSDAVGMIIGKGGETIREMQNTTGCKINVSQSSGSGETEREIGLVGSRDSIERAKVAIREKVEAAQNKSGGGGRGGHRDGGGARGHHRDYDNPNYGHASNQQNAPQSMPASSATPAAGAGGEADPYAAYGGYDAYVALWWQSQYGAQLGGQTGASQPPGAGSS
ncbi:hypothetical protein QC763_311410 [Podospora pseudopauciseta]|uniref:K Homology domain-containing protein n=1 Tax=Podospora pseudopauciseta TaxID=2093780 RepID=A0ABR0HI80_9PEZI|nr:hypothetical protein QC763_311410 [Podospora pseudopauciseta]